MQHLWRQVAAILLPPRDKLLALAVEVLAVHIRKYLLDLSRKLSLVVGQGEVPRARPARRVLQELLHPAMMN